MTKNREDEGMKKLVEEMTSIFDARCMMRLDGFNPISEMSGIYEAKRRQRILAKELITRILQAIAGGELKLPGEVGRFLWRDWSDETQVAFDDWFDLVDKGMTFIALSPEGHRSRSLREEEEG